MVRKICCEVSITLTTLQVFVCSPLLLSSLSVLSQFQGYLWWLLRSFKLIHQLFNLTTALEDGVHGWVMTNFMSDPFWVGSYILSCFSCMFLVRVLSSHSLISSSILQLFSSEIWNNHRQTTLSTWTGMDRNRQWILMPQFCPQGSSKFPIFGEHCSPMLVFGPLFFLLLSAISKETSLLCEFFLFISGFHRLDPDTWQGICSALALWILYRRDVGSSNDRFLSLFMSTSQGLHFQRQVK